MNDRAKTAPLAFAGGAVWTLSQGRRAAYEYVTLNEALGVIAA